MGGSRALASRAGWAWPAAGSAWGLAPPPEVALQQASRQLAAGLHVPLAGLLAGRPAPRPVLVVHQRLVERREPHERGDHAQRAEPVLHDAGVGAMPPGGEFPRARPPGLAADFDPGRKAGHELGDHERLFGSSSISIGAAFSAPPISRAFPRDAAFCIRASRALCASSLLSDGPSSTQPAQ